MKIQESIRIKKKKAKNVELDGSLIKKVALLPQGSNF